MRTTIEIVTRELETKGFPTTGIYSSIPKSTYNLVNNILHFGQDAVNKSVLGAGIKKIALELAAKDPRKAVIRNGKTILA